MNEFKPYDLFSDNKFQPYDLFSDEKYKSGTIKFEPYDLFKDETNIDQDRLGSTISTNQYQSPYLSERHKAFAEQGFPMMQNKEGKLMRDPNYKSITNQNPEANKYMETTEPSEYVVKGAKTVLSGMGRASASIFDFVNWMAKQQTPFYNDQFKSYVKKDLISKGLSNDNAQVLVDKMTESILDKPINDAYSFADQLKKEGLGDTIPGMVLGSLGSAAVDIPKYMLTGFIAPFILEGMKQGSEQAVQKNEDPLWGSVKGGTVGAAKGYANQKLIGLSQVAPVGLKHLTSAVVGGAVPAVGEQVLSGQNPLDTDNIKQTISSAITMGLFPQGKDRISIKDLFKNDFDTIKNITGKDIPVQKDNEIQIEEIAKQLVKEVPAESKFKPVQMIDEKTIPDVNTGNNLLIREYKDDIKAKTQEGNLPDGTPYTSIMEIQRTGTPGAGVHMYDQMIDKSINEGGVFLTDAIGNEPKVNEIVTKLANEKGLNVSVIGKDQAGNDRLMVSKWESQYPDKPENRLNIPEGQMLSKVYTNTAQKIGIQEQLNPMDMMYEVHSHEWRNQKAQERLQMNGSDSVFNRILSKGTADDVDNVIVGNRINELAKNITPENAKQIRDLVNSATPKITSAAQLVESQKQWQETSLFAANVKAASDLFKEIETKKVKRKIDESLNNAKPGTDLDKLSKELKKKMGVPDLDTETLNHIKKFTDEIEKYPEDSVERFIKEAEYGNYLSSKMPVDWTKKAASLQTMAMLIRPKSWIKNFVGNTVWSGVNKIEQNVFATPLDKLISLKTGKRTTAATSLEQEKNYAKTFTKKLIEDWKLASQRIDINSKLLNKRIKELTNGEFDTSEMFKRQDVNDVGGKFELQPQTFKNNTLIKGEILLSQAMRSPDRAAFWATFEDSIYNQLKASEKSIPTENMIEQAISEGMQLTFNDKNLASYLSRRFKNFVNETTGLGGEVINKFPRTPMNMLVRGIEHTPLALPKFLWNLGKVLKYGDIKTEREGRLKNSANYGSLQRQTAILGGRMLFGSAALTLVGYLGGKLGFISGGESDKKTQLDMATGKQNRAFNVDAFMRWIATGFDEDAARPKQGDEYKDYDFLGPFAIPLSIGASYYHVNDKEIKDKSATNLGSMVIDSYLSSADVIAEQPMSRGIKMLTGGRDVLSVGKNMIKSIPASFVPGLASDLALAISPTIKDSYSENTIDSAWMMIKKRLPILSKILPTQVDVLGNKRNIFPDNRSTTGKVLDIISIFGKPWISKEYKASPGIQFVEKLYEQTGESNILPIEKKTPSIKDKQGKKIQFSQEDRNYYQEIFGSMYEQRINELLPKLNNIKDTERQVKFLMDIINQVGNYSRRKFLIEKGY